MKKNKKYEEEIKELLQERLGQIYKNIVNEKIVKEAKDEENNLEEILEKILKKETKEGFKIYCSYEEIRSKYLNLLLTKYYEQGVKDGIKMIIKNII